MEGEVSRSESDPTAALSEFRKMRGMIIILTYPLRRCETAIQDRRLHQRCKASHRSPKLRKYRQEMRDMQPAWWRISNPDVVVV
jgi:hypothetical protein